MVLRVGTLSRATFGHSVAASADKTWLFVGAYAEAACSGSNLITPGCAHAGAGYVYQYGADGRFSLVNYLKGESAPVFPLF